MKSAYAQTKINFLNFLFNDLEKKQIDPQIQSYLAQYLTVLICGIYEVIIENLLMEFIQKDPISVETIEFTYNCLDQSFRNPNQGNLKKVLKRFNKEWPLKLDSRLKDEDWKALDSIAYHKNLIAHGQQTQITYNDIKKYYFTSKKIIIEIDSLFL